MEGLSTLQCCLQDASSGSADGSPDESSMSMAEPATSVAGSVASAADSAQQKPPQDIPCSAAQLAMLAQGPRMPGPHVFVFRLLGTVCWSTLQEAINMMVSQHEALRTHIMQPDAARPWQRITTGVALEATIYQQPEQLADMYYTEAGSMPGWIGAAVADLQQLVMTLDKAPLAAIHVYEVGSMYSFNTQQASTRKIIFHVVHAGLRVCRKLLESVIGFCSLQAMMAVVLKRRFVWGSVPEPAAVAAAASAATEGTLDLAA